MAIPKSPISFLFLLFIAAALLRHTAAINATEELVSDLLELQSKSYDARGRGVIYLTDQLLRRIISIPTPRPFDFLVFFDAKQLHAKSELNLQSLKTEFALVSESFIENNHDDYHRELFFFELEFGQSQSSFSLFAVNSLPHIKLIPKAAVDIAKDSIQMEAADFSGRAEGMGEFVDRKTDAAVGPIRRPPWMSRRQLMVMIAVTLIWTPFIVKKILSGKTMLHNKGLWMMGAVFVYFFSVSGTMFNIIRKMPMFLQDRNDPKKLVFFHQGQGMQLGAEGFAVGFLYSVVGLLLACAIHLLVAVRSRNAQRILMLVVLTVSFWAVQKVVFLDNWKTGYRINAYWPSSWR